MFKRLLTNQRPVRVRLLLTVALLGCLVWLAATFFRRPAPVAGRAMRAASAPVANAALEDAPRPLNGDGARRYLEQTSEGQSLMKALEAERFGLKRQERSPFGDAGGGYLGMSHDENLNAWFDAEGVTVRPTLSKKESDTAWRLGMRLKAYGYGYGLSETRRRAPHTVSENRIEYERGARVVEWFVNKSAGIEQGFTLSERPARKEGVAEGEPLRLVVSVSGDLRARATEGGQAIELNRGGESVLSYSHLAASDATGRKLAARMETNREGDEIALVVDDAEAEYPIVVDPTTATQKQELDAGSSRQEDARFGFAVAIEGDFAVVGAWREDKPSGLVDAGHVYTFARSGNTWVSGNGYFYNFFGAGCGWSVAISGSQVVFGCPGADSNKGSAFIFRRGNTTQQPLDPGSAITTGDRYGESVGIDGRTVAVGAPYQDTFGQTDSGSVFYYLVDIPSLIIVGSAPVRIGNGANSRFGTSVDVQSGVPRDKIIVGTPGANSERGVVYEVNIRIQGSATFIGFQIYRASDGAPGDQFGNSVAVSGDTMVVGTPLDDNERGTDAGAAYVFVRGSDDNWTQQQKLMAGDGRPNDYFGEHALAIEGKTIVVGAYGNGTGGDPLNGIPDDDRGAVYVFTRSGTVWTQQTKISQNNFQDGEAGDQFGIDVDLSGTALLIGARGASAGSVLRGGAAFIYELSCAPPYNVAAIIGVEGGGAGSTSLSTHRGNNVSLVASKYVSPDNTTLSIQWRKDGVPIPGKTTDAFLIRNACEADAGTYDVVITNSCGSEISNPVTLTITPRITGHPATKTVCESGSVTWPDGEFKVKKIPTGQSTYQWRRNGVGISNQFTIPTGSGEYTSSFTFFPVQADAGSYVVAVTDACTTEFSNPVTLTVLSNSISANSQSFTTNGGTGAVGVTACMAGGDWTAQSNASWITITTPASPTTLVSGNGNVIYSVAANTGPQRTGTLTIAGQTFTITQASDCTFSIAPTSQNFPASAASGAVTVTSGAGCAWTATSNASFLTITSGASGTGNGTVNYSVSANSSTSGRSGTLTIAEQTFTVTQDGAAPPPPPPPPTVQLSQSSYGVSEGALFAAINVTRTGDTSAAATVKYQTSDTTDVNFRCDPSTAGQMTGVASRKCDYHIASGRLRFNAGEVTKQIILSIVDDVYVEGTESFTLALSGATGLSLGANSSATITITDNDVAGQPNPIDGTRFFVHQLYVDLLSREPEAGGWDGWTHRIDFCGQPGEPPPPCDRVTVGGDGFLSSAEFFERQFFVLRLYRTGLGRILLYDEVGDLAYVSGFLTDQQLELNKQELVAEIMARSGFANRYNGLANASFVNTLLQTAGVTVPQSVQDAWVTALDNNSKTRAQVYREISERQEVANKYLHEAQVVSAYYGFFTRNPDGAYLNYLDRLDRGEINLGDLANAFINASEYRQRFGP